MTAFGFFLVAFTACLIVRLSEIWVHCRHQRWIVTQGGSEPNGGWHRLFFGASAIFPLFSLCEHAAHLTEPSSTLIMLGLSAVPLGLMLRLWAMRSLGPFWTIGHAEIAGYPRRLNVGPYRYSDRPDMWAWLFEAVALCLILGAVLTAIFITLILLIFLTMSLRAEASRLTTVSGTSKVPRPVRLR